MNRVCLYFVASPLHYLCACSIAREFEKSSRNILVYYKKSGLEEIIEKNFWEKVIYMPHPRKEPLGGLFGKIKRISANLTLVTQHIKGATEICVHSSEYDTEAINYFVHYLQTHFTDAKTEFCLIPDGVLNLSLHRLSVWHIIRNALRIFRSLIDKNLLYTVFSGDRIGSEANFVKKIYILNGFSHKYDDAKVVELPPLASFDGNEKERDKKRALVIGQYLSDKGELTTKEVLQLSSSLKSWLLQQGIDKIDYKGHPRDTKKELFEDGYNQLVITEALESYMSKNRYDIVVSIFSTALITARQIYPKSVRVVSFGLDWVNFKDKKRKGDILQLFKKLGVEIV